MNPNSSLNKPPNPNSGLTMVAGLLAAFFLTGPIYDGSIDGVVQFAYEQYGGWTQGLVRPGWFGLCGGGIYFFSRIAANYLIEYVKFQHSLRSARKRF